MVPERHRRRHCSWIRHRLCSIPARHLAPAAVSAAPLRIDAIDYRADDAEARFVASLRDTGFGVLRNHPLDEDTVSSIYAHWKAFFASDDKHDYRFDPERYDGYFPAGEAETAKGHAVRDLKEYFHFYPWGRCPAALQSELQDYYARTVEFAATLLGWVERRTPAQVAARFSEPLSGMIEGSEQSLLRILHYPPLEAAPVAGAVRAAAHEDINLLTVLPAANEPGLQARTAAGDWIDVPCDFGSLIINVGDMLQEASGGYYPSTTHRVINPSGEHVARGRISLPLFLHPRREVRLSQRHTAGSYLDERLAQLRGERP